MLALRPTCEHCDKELPPNSIEAMICSFECTFCEQCVTTVLANVCPNCGGGFCPRPVRPGNNLKNNNCLTKYPATSEVTHKPIDLNTHSEFSLNISKIRPQDR